MIAVARGGTVELDVKKKQLEDVAYEALKNRGKQVDEQIVTDESGTPRSHREASKRTHI